MKTIITILIFCLITVTTQIKAQGPVQGSYIINNTMGAFHGTWLWTNGADTVRLYLVTKKVYCNVNGGFYWDCLVGWHLYKKGNTIIESSYSYINDIGLSTILGGNEGSGNSNKIQDGT